MQTVTRTGADGPETKLGCYDPVPGYRDAIHGGAECTKERIDMKT